MKIYFDETKLNGGCFNTQFINLPKEYFDFSKPLWVLNYLKNTFHKDHIVVTFIVYSYYMYR